MPTGYTAHIENGCSFEEFVWECARAFVAWARDNDGPLPKKIEPEAYHVDQIAKIRRQIKRIQRMTPRQLDAAATADEKRSREIDALSLRSKDETKAKYAAMLQKVREWQPPSPSLNNLKQMMIEQIDGSMASDCRVVDTTPARPISGRAWKSIMLVQLKRELDYHRSQHEDEKRRMATTNHWLAVLRMSVPQPKSRLK